MIGKGWIPESYDSRDKPYISPLGGKKAESVDLSNEHGDWLRSIYNQYDTGSCVANATAAAYRFAAKKQNASVKDHGAAEIVEPSRLFIYYNARILPELQRRNIKVNSGDPLQSPPFTKKMFDPDGGSQNRNSFKVLNLFGVCTEDTWQWVNEEFTMKDGEKGKHPTLLNKVPDDKAYEEAKRSLAVEYCRLDPDHSPEVEKRLTDDDRTRVGNESLDKLKQCLTEGYPVVLGFWFYDENPFEHKNNEWTVKPFPVEYAHKGPPTKDANGEKVDYGGHTVLCIGYSDKRQQILCQNSWGETWSDDPAPMGQFWMPYSYVADWEATDDFWMVRSIQGRKAL